MHFKLAIKNNNGIFKVHLNREVSQQEIIDICQIATNLVPCDSQVSPTHYGPHQEDVSYIQTKLGEKPVDNISMGSYKEPDDGVRIKMLHMPEKKLDAVRAFRRITDISMLGCKEIIVGNHPCPILQLEKAQEIIEEFHRLGIYAKIVPAFVSAA
jgi:hypothetical protein